MVASIAAIASAVGGLASAGSQIFRKNTQGPQQEQINQGALTAAQGNDAYQRALSTLINQRSIAGYQDDLGSSLRYDPATNTWVSTLGALPKAEQTAASQAAISRNTTDLRTAQEANRAASLRASQANPAYDSAIRALSQFRPQSSEDIGNIVSGQAINANSATMRPLIESTLTNFARGEQNAGRPLADIGRQSYSNLRDALTTGRMQALSGTDQLNNARRQGLEGAATTAAGLANPSLQFSGIQPSDQSKTMAQLLASRAATASTAPAFGAAGVNTAAGQSQAAFKNLAAGVPDPNADINSANAALKTLGSTFSNKDTLSGLANLFGSSKRTDLINSIANQDIGFGPGKVSPDQ